ncbi:MAG: amidohydrolase, partial [Oscillospiraceae bacterium]|nr:amidohydrolase [Oscillospiraceae bacterium]
HSWQLAAQSGCCIGEKGMLAAAKAMAHAAVWAMSHPEIVAQAGEEHQKNEPYQCAIPDDMMPPIGK